MLTSARDRESRKQCCLNHEKKPATPQAEISLDPAKCLGHRETKKPKIPGGADPSKEKLDRNQVHLWQTHADGKGSEFTHQALTRMLAAGQEKRMSPIGNTVRQGGLGYVRQTRTHHPTQNLLLQNAKVLTPRARSKERPTAGGKGQKQKPWILREGQEVMLGPGSSTETKEKSAALRECEAEAGIPHSGRL